MILKRRNLVFRFLPGLFLSGLLLLSGCSQDDVSDVPAGSRAIGFRAQGAMSSLKATTVTKDHIQSFVVNAHYNKTAGWAGGDYLLQGTTVYRGEGGGDSWTYSPQAYFPTDNATVEGDTYVEFMAYSPSASTNVDKGLKAATDATQTITYTVPKPLATGVTAQEDFLVAYERKEAATSGSAYSGTVNLQFRHALSRVLVAAASSLTEPVTITGLVLHNLYTTGDLPVKSASTVWTPAAAWDNYSYILPPAGVSVTQYPASQPAPSPLPLVTSNEQGMFVLPQTTAGNLLPAESDTIQEFYLEIKYSIGGLSKEPHYIQFGDLVAPTSGTGVTFEPGKQYVLNLTFGSGSGTGGGGSDQPSVDIGATISFGELGVDGYGPDITVPKPKVFEPVAVVWSQSNVYFEDTETAGDGIGVLTFAESNTPLDKNLYQGVFFKWGSLIGVSTDNSFSSSSLFIPDLSTGKYHRVAVSSLAGHVDLTDVVGLFKKRLTDLGVSNFANYSDIYAKLPYVTQADMTGDVPVKIPTLSGASYVDDNGLTAASGTALYDTYRGDICKYLADKNSASGNSLTKGTWRLPTSREFGNGGTNYSDGSSFSDPAPGDYDTQWNKDYSGTPGSFAADINGAGELDKNSTENWYYTLVRWIFDPAKDNLSTTPSFPASGYRNDNDGGLGGVGSLGYYWSTSVSNDAAYVLNLRFVSGNVNPYSSNYRTGGNSVRCVRDGENVAP